MAERRLLLIGGSRVVELRQAAWRRGLETLTLVPEEEEPDAEGPADLDRYQRIDIHRPVPALLRLILELHETRPFVGIVPILEYGLVPAALAARRLGLPGPSPAAVEHTSNKQRMREVLEQAGLGQLRYAVCDSPAAAAAFRQTLDGPMIVKPVNGTGSDGVSRVDTADGVAAAFELAASAKGTSGVICEEFIAGPEVSLEGCFVDGRLVPVAVTDKRSDERFLELGHTQPSRHSPEVQQQAWALAARTLAALGVAYGPCHTEMRLSPRGPVMMETHTRMGGDFIHVLTALTTGVDLADVVVGLALGETPEVAPRPTGVAAAVAYLPALRGRVVACELPKTEPDSGIQRSGLGVFMKPGNILSGRSASWERGAHAVAVGVTAAAALDAAAHYLASARIVVEDTPGVR